MDWQQQHDRATPTLAIKGGIMMMGIQ